ncbi:MAG: hypothetical protein HY736_08285 [Verrucomicrobia bacterium]|nr:hypothetical protein [Verrucomicrobiota bacterium]
MNSSDLTLGLASSALLAAGMVRTKKVDPSRTPYVHKFADGHGGWFSDRQHALRIWDGIAHCYSPWFLDANHAPPGAGYLHLILWIYTDKRWYQPDGPAAACLPYLASSFVEQGKSRDLRNARLTVRLRGEADLKGAKLVLLAQSRTAKKPPYRNMVLTGQPIRITEDWSEQTIVLVNDPREWTPIGSRKSLAHVYGNDDVGGLLADVSYNLILCLFPIKVVPASKGVTDPHGLVAGVDYPVDVKSLPKGLIQFESIRIDYPTK